MYPGKNNILLTGFPGVGKTTFIRKISEELKNLHPAGFYTEEIIEEGVRKGFELVGLDGKRRLLSHVDIKNSNRVGKYRVDVKGFEDFLDSIAFFALQAKLIIIDEIGKMECMSTKFKKLIKEIIDSEKIVIATIAFKGSGFIDEIKKRNDSKLFEITERNRDSLLEKILSYLKKSINNV